MSTTSWVELVISVVALVILGIAAIVDVGTNLMSRTRLRQLAESRPAWQRTIPSMVEPGRALTASFQMVQVIAVIIMATLLTSVALRELSSSQRLIAIVLVVVLYLLFGRALPRALAVTRPNRSADAMLHVGTALNWLAWPFRIIVDRAADAFSRLLPRSAGEPPPVATEDEFRAYALETDDDGVIEAGEREMIHGILHLEELSARDIMVPRIDVVAVEVSEPFSAILKRITGAGHSRIPVFEESIDHLQGILYAKDLLPYAAGKGASPVIKDLLRPLYVVPESKRVSDLLTELRRQRVHIAIVVDEYGGVAGLVTIEDILEEIVGEIQDEYDVEQPRLEIISADELITDGRLPVQDAEEALHLKLELEEHDDFGTLGGLVQARLGRLPRSGDEFDVDRIHVEVIEVERHRIRRLRLIRRPEISMDDGEGAAPMNVQLNGAASK